MGRGATLHGRAADAQSCVVPKRRKIFEDEAPDEPAPTAQPRDRPEAFDDEDRLVPVSNVGGAAPSPHGHDSGGDLPGDDDDLASLVEPEPPDSPEVDAVHVRAGEDAAPRGRRR
jgi:hypothetical protein